MILEYVLAIYFINFGRFWNGLVFYGFFGDLVVWKGEERRATYDTNK